MEKDFLKEGEQTKITPKIKEIVADIPGEGLDFVLNALVWVGENIAWKADHPDKNNLLRTRTADEIIRDGFATGCTDMALVFIVLARAKGIPARYVETVSRKWLESPSNQMEGHIFVECFVNGRWIKVEPTAGKIFAHAFYKNCPVLDRGLDSWDIGVHNINDLLKKFKAFAAEDTK